MGLLVAVLERSNVELLTLAATFLRRLSVYHENKAAIAQVGGAVYGRMKGCWQSSRLHADTAIACAASCVLQDTSMRTWHGRQCSLSIPSPFENPTSSRHAM